MYSINQGQNSLRIEYEPNEFVLFNSKTKGGFRVAKRPETLEELREAAQRGDVSFELIRFTTKATMSELDEIRRQGFISQARVWLESMTPERMRFGLFSRRERLEEAEKFATKAGISLEDIAAEAGLLYMLSLDPEGG